MRWGNGNAEDERGGVVVQAVAEAGEESGQGGDQSLGAGRGLCGW